MLHELQIPFARAACVALFEIDDAKTVTIPDVRERAQQSLCGVVKRHAYADPCAG